MSFRNIFRRPDVRYLDNNVVHFKGRPFPDATLPGDALWMWRFRINRVVKRARELGDEEIINESVALQQMILYSFDRYNEVCKRFGMGGWASPDDGLFSGPPKESGG